MVQIDPLRASGQMGEINKKLFFYLYFFISGSHTGQTHGWTFTRDSSKDVKSRKDVSFVLMNDDVPLNFGGKTAKNRNFGGVNRTFKPERQKNSNPYNLKTTWPITTKFLQGVRTKNAPSWWSHGSPTNPIWRRPPSLISGKCQ